MESRFYPEDYGARADGRHMNTEAFQEAIDACSQAGGGIVWCGPGAYLIGSIMLKSNVELHLSAGCTLLASTNIADYADLISDGFKREVANERTARCLIGASRAENIAITGPGEINGRGNRFYDQSRFRRSGQFAEKPAERARIVMFHKCKNIRFEDTSYVDSACWTFWLMMCQRVSVHRLRIDTDRRMINTDGMDFDACRDVTVSDCVMNTEDDCLVFRAIQKVHYEPAICENITVSNCTLDSMRNSIRISCPSDYVTRNCVFVNLVMMGNNGVFMHFPARFLDAAGKGRAEVTEILFSNIVMDCEKYPVRIEVEEGVRIPKISGISFSNIRASSKMPFVVKGNSETLVEDVTLSNIRLSTQGSQALVCANCRNVKLSNVEVNSLDAVE